MTGHQGTLPRLAASEASGATFSPCAIYRYRLWRYWNPAGTVCCFVLLNPSTADETYNDPTVARCLKYAKRWGHGGLEVVNIFALRSTDPRALRGHPDPVGPENDEAIRLATAVPRGGVVVAAWGAHGALGDRSARVNELLRGQAVHCLGTTKAGQPRHPLYLRSDAELVRYTGA